MSLIQDALKRQQDETESGRIRLKSAVPPPVPDSMPVQASPAPPPSPPVDPPASGAGRKPLRVVPPATPSATPPDRPPSARLSPLQPAPSGKSWPRIAGIVILCVLIAWGGGLVAALVFKKSAARTLLGAFLPNLNRARPAMDQTSAQPPLSSAEPFLLPEPEPAPAVAPEAASPVVAVPEIAPEPAVAPPAEHERKTGADIASFGVFKRDKKASAPGPAPVVWPRLKLSAVFSNAGAGRSGARLNNKLVLLGDRIEGVTLVEIRRDSVVVKCGDQTRSLKMGMTLY